MIACAGSFNVCQAARCLTAGGVIAYPTEAVWGLGCDPFNEAAVQRILTLKQRPVSKGLIMIAADVEQCLAMFEGIGKEAIARISIPQAKPTTWIIQNNGSVPQWISGQHDSFALRITNHPYAKTLCQAFGGPVVSTSANPSSKPEARTRLAAIRYFANDVDFYMAGTTGHSSSPSQIIELNTGRVLRASL